MQKLVTYFKATGAKYVFDVSWAENLSLLESCYEFVEKYNAKQLPLYTSICPGWICYAEKTHPEILPKISSVKSAQQMMGSIVKRFMAQKMKIFESEIYHVSIMSCFDKKLEASREDFTVNESREVDCVLTTSEIEGLIGNDFKNLPETKMDNVFANLDENGDLLGHRGTSGGYLEIVMRYAAQTLFNVSLQEIVYKQGKNRDYREAILEHNGVKLLHFVQAYGFRNIQNIVKKFTSPIHYIEVMACPSGCLNGGGQIKPKDGVRPKDLLDQVERIHSSIQVKFDLFDVQVKTLYEEWIKGGINSKEAKTLLHTQYHEREKMQSSGLTIKW
jgi:iron only hydrogenase large subunit-like protein